MRHAVLLVSSVALANITYFTSQFFITIGQDYELTVIDDGMVPLGTLPGSEPYYVYAILIFAAMLLVGWGFYAVLCRQYQKRIQLLSQQLNKPQRLDKKWSLSYLKSKAIEMEGLLAARLIS